jgi:hypothetical protein
MRSVLTTNPFNYVDLWLRRKHESDALFYWRQARAFLSILAGSTDRVISSRFVLLLHERGEGALVSEASSIQRVSRGGISSYEGSQQQSRSK